MRKTHDLVVSTGEYTQDGQTKKRWKNIGVAFTDDEGRMSLKLETVPLPKMDEKGYPEIWIKMFASDDSPSSRNLPQHPPHRSSAPRPPSGDAPSGEDEDDVPF